MIALLVGASTPGCTKVTRHVAPFEPSTELLHRGETELFVKSRSLNVRSSRHRDASHVRYLAKLDGQKCSAKKWTELTVKSLRARTSTKAIDSISEATYEVHDPNLLPGDIIRFASRARSPSHGVIIKHLGDHTYTAYTVIKGRIAKIKVNQKYGRTRRRRGQVINTFLRVIKQGDRLNGYLAGELIVGVQRPETNL